MCGKVTGKVKQHVWQGPKFGPHPELDKVEMLSLMRSCTSRVKEEDVTQCVSEGVDALPAKPKHSALVRTNKVVFALKDADLKLLCSDKEGGFAVLPSAFYSEKAKEAVLNNFKAAPDVKPQKVKKEVLRLCEELALRKFARSVKKSR
ncbi:hypothetical protein HPB48_022373 [Haemaphysalis longicornis]|uniref:Uncharacterized protein n=1 Tax=Haemaphysalis longicornis TaxID=44386 RepID=A0A9J6FBR3_HAELO|nr:hypothetical protein HPB48_022373 [Haemaphysalis longicornis]